MELQNQTNVEAFLLVGFPENMQICVLFFMVLFLMYIFIIFGNVFLITAIIISPKLHLPMYFFLCNLAFIDISFSTTTLPRIFIDIFSITRTISVTGCMVQMHIGRFMGCGESFLLAVMAYDRYVAITLPLYYNIIMNWKVCMYIIIFMWHGDFFISVFPLILRPLVFCAAYKLDHIGCEMLAVLELACGDITYFRVTMLAVSVVILVLPLFFIVGSYIVIISSILKIRSTEGRSKAFSTCASHLTVVSMFYGTSISMYVGQKKSLSSNLKYIALVYAVITPALNPLIYSLRNNDVKKVFHRMFVKHHH